MKSTIKIMEMLMILCIIHNVFSTSFAITLTNVTLDGTINEADWNYWLKDDSGKPVLDFYWMNSSEYLFIGISTDDNTDNIDLLEFSFKGSEEDYWIQIIPEVSLKYSIRETAPTPLFQGWWKTANTGLPPGVNIVDGDTDGNRSYEISIELALLGSIKSNLPNNLKLWYKVHDGVPDGPYNYPDSYLNWKFYIEKDIERDVNNIPKFHVPEYPFGTILTLISMFLATLFFMKEKTLTLL